MASIALDEFEIGSNLERSDLTSLLSKLKTKLWPHLKCQILSGKNGRWILGASIKNLDKAEGHFEG